MDSNWSYGLETDKWGHDLCDLEPWPLTVTFCMDVTSVNGNKSWKFQDDMMTGTLSKRCDGRTHRQTDGHTDRQTIISVLRVAWSQLKIKHYESTRIPVSLYLCVVVCCIAWCTDSPGAFLLTEMGRFTGMDKLFYLEFSVGCNHSSMPCHRAGFSTLPQFHVDAIIHPCPKLELHLP